MAVFDGRHIQRIVILAGAGVSAESGLATFRDAAGPWENHDPMTLATPEAFQRGPATVEVAGLVEELLQGGRTFPR